MSQNETTVSMPMHEYESLMRQISDIKDELHEARVLRNEEISKDIETASLNKAININEFLISLLLKDLGFGEDISVSIDANWMIKGAWDDLDGLREKDSVETFYSISPRSAKQIKSVSFRVKSEPFLDVKIT